ncbi:diacylglycerol kinase [Bacillaceae bacterium]
MMKRARLIYNPSAGREEVRRNLPDILERLETGGYETSCYATKGGGDATREARRAVERNFDLVIAAGGDGTIYEVVNGLAEQKNRPVLGIIPAGTTNDFARALGIPRSIVKACDIIVNGQTRPVDIGKINDKYFINIAGGGSMTDLTYEVPSKLKTVLGQLAYYMKGMEKLPFIRPTRMRLETKEQVIEEDIMLFLIANSNSVGGFEKLVPTADLSDGLFDCLVVKKTSLAEFIRLATLALKGEHIKDPHILLFRTDYLRVTSEGDVQLNLDGELGGKLPCEFTVLPAHLTVMVPPQSPLA